MRIAPYVVTGAVVAVLLRKYPAADIGRQMMAGHALAMLPLALALPFVLWFPYAVYDRIVFEATVGPIALRDVIRAKAASALLLALGYIFGGGGYAVWIVRKTRVGPARASGAVLYLMSSDLMAVCAVAAAAMWLGGADVPRSLRSVATWVLAVQTAFVVLGPYGGWLHLPEVFAPWRLVPRARSFVQIAGRAGNIAIITGFIWAAMRAFGIEVPVRVAAMYLPVIILVGALPINVAGLGAAQAAWLLLLPWASGPQLLAFHTLWILFSSLGVLARGLPFVRGVVRDVGQVGQVGQLEKSTLA